MKKGMIVAVVAVCVAVFALLMQDRLYSQQDSPSIGVIDLIKVTHQYKKWVKLATELERKEEQLNSQLDAKEADLKKQKEKVASLKKGSEQWEEIQKKMSTLKIEMEGLASRGRELLIEEMNRMGRQLVTDVKNAIEEHSRVHRLDIVLQVEELQLSNVDWRDINLALSRQTVMYHKSGIDITNDVVKILNDSYAREMKEGNDK